VSDLFADSSALAKLLVEEPETAALEAYVTVPDASISASALVRVELARVVRVRNPAAAPKLHDLLAGLTLVPVVDRVLAVAASLGHARLRSLDAVHLASAVVAGADRLLVYDRELAEAAEAAGIQAVAPGR
jgi:uncharacterized protein